MRRRSDCRSDSQWLMRVAALVAITWVCSVAASVFVFAPWVNTTVPRTTTIGRDINSAPPRTLLKKVSPTLQGLLGGGSVATGRGAAAFNTTSLGGSSTVVGVAEGRLPNRMLERAIPQCAHTLRTAVLSPRGSTVFAPVSGW